MTAETNEWINEHFLCGFCEQRKPWWASQSNGSNMFQGAVPPDRVIRLLEKAHAVEGKLFTAHNGLRIVEGSKAIIIPGMKNAVVGLPSNDYQIHQYLETLYLKIEKLLNGIGVASTGLTERGAKAWVQLEHPNNENAAGLKFRPGLLFGSSLDGKLKTIVKRTLVAVVCDNTFAWALGDTGETVKVKHTSNSLARLEDSGDAWKAISDLAETAGHSIERAAKRVVTDRQFSEFLDKLVPVPTDEGRGKTIAQNKRISIADLYNSDARAATWRGSVLGVMQAVNTWNLQESTVRNAEHRAERQMDNLLMGKLDIMDRIAMETLNKVLVAA